MSECQLKISGSLVEISPYFDEIHIEHVRSLNGSDFSFLTGFNNLDFTCWFSYFLAMKKQMNS